MSNQIPLGFSDISLVLFYATILHLLNFTKAHHSPLLNRTTITVSLLDSPSLLSLLLIHSQDHWPVSSDTTSNRSSCPKILLHQIQIYLLHFECPPASHLSHVTHSLTFVIILQQSLCSRPTQKKSPFFSFLRDLCVLLNHLNDSVFWIGK